ncbi:MAG: NADH:ubiquinone reductase (Na(+)-transporting) subunit C [Bacteroidales bacterium]|nr:NADH:ubiquinone reductase (Na(+)-transporting) subunit C [Bacteroidales bacterium]
MNKNSNSYIFIYASVMVVLVAVILTSANLALKPLQDKNKENEKMINLLSSIGIDADANNASELYSKHLKKEVIINENGEELSTYANGELTGSKRAFGVNLKTALYNAGKGEVAMPLFVMDNNGETYYVIPLFGKGLWGPIYGNISIESDKNTVAAVNFGHDSETPGLGAEIILPAFTDEFKNKQIFKDGEFTSVSVVKGGVDMQTKVAKENGVDAISGSTLTCDGVTDMLHDCMINYVKYLKQEDK